ncbi:MAG: ATP-binding protein [Acidobacteriota bacterium]
MPKTNSALGARRSFRRDALLLPLCFVVLGLCLFWIYAFATMPDPGFSFAPDSWVVESPPVQCADSPDICPEIGDQLVRIGSVDKESFLGDRRVFAFRDVPTDPDGRVAVVFERDGQVYTSFLKNAETEWTLSLFATLFFPMVFWAAGTAAAVFLHPRDSKWAILVILFFDTALWGASGFNSGMQNALGSIAFRFFVWWFTPLLIHLHLILPSRPFRRLEKALLPPLYGIGLIFVILDLLVVYVPRNFIELWILVGVLASVTLMVYRFFLRDSFAGRIAHRIIFFGFVMGVAPIMLLAAVHSLLPSGDITFFSTLTGALFLFIVPIWPGSYLYALYRHRPGTSELRANRLLGSYGFYTLFATVFVSCFTVGTNIFEDVNAQLAFNLILSLFFVGVAAPLKSIFQRQVDRRVYGVRYQPDEVVSLFAKRIPGAFNRSILRSVLTSEVLPTLLIRRSALYLVDGDAVDAVYEQDVDSTPAASQIEELRRRCEADKNLSLPETDAFGWVHLIIRLSTQERLIGVWLLGRRDPDDYYPRSDIELLKNLANQIAPVTENVRLLEMARLEVAENRRLQQQLVQSQKMEAIGRLSAGVAHDFNNLLSVILGYSSLVMARYGQADDKLAKYLGDIRDAGSRAAQLTKQLLAFSRQQVMEAKVLDLNVVVGDVEKMLRRMTGEDVLVVTQYGADLPPVKVDPGQLGQVVMNLAVNARDAMPSGGSLTISTYRRVLPIALEHDEQAAIPQGEWAVLEVSDTGTGVSAELLPRIFEPYFTTKELGKGTGLGLSMVYGIINQSQGHVHVESQIDVGTTFRVYLPASQEAPAAAPAEPVRPAESRTGDETILVVEDEESVRTVAVEILRTKGYRVLAADSGPSALDVARAEAGRIDLLLTDVVMPQMKGTELASRMIEALPSLKVLYMSGYNEESILGEAGDLLIQKPFSPRVLARRVREMLDTSI